MKNIFKPTLVATVALGASAMMTGCLEETFPTSGVLQNQLSESSKSLEAVASGMPAYMKAYAIWPINGKAQATDFGYPSMMIAHDVLTNDMIQNYNGYQHFRVYQSVTVGMDDQYAVCQIAWYYYNFMARTCNTLIEGIDENTENPAELNYLAAGLAYRASTYLDMARTYEFLPNNDISPVNKSGKDVTGLTVPVNVPGMTAEQLNNNPRLPHDEMVEFLIGDLEKAEALFKKAAYGRTSKLMPDLSVVYGLLARVYMWDENYPKAAEYARLAISTSGATPLTREQWLSTSQGFNDMSMPAWMWAIQYESNDDIVNDTYSNWASFMATECTLGYAGNYKCCMNIDKSLYEQISNSDFRKLSFIAPEGSPLSGMETFVPGGKGKTYPAYTNIKFRPGQGNLTDNTIFWAVSIPLMRVEEMYLIEAEAVAHTSPGQGKQLLETFMKTYRYPTYACNATDVEGVVDECFLQKRIELWGEGQIFYDYKRLNKSVTRSYDGTNWPETCRYNTDGRPGWMNWPFVDYEANFNKGVEEYLNPNVGDQFTSID